MKCRKWGALGKHIDKEHRNPILDTSIYKLELTGRRVDEYEINIIIENTIDQVDDQVWDTGILE